MLKKFKCIPALFLVIILFAGCAQKETPYISNEYVLEYENDKCYMLFKGEKVEEKDSLVCIPLFFGLNFTSLDELKDTIINEKFTDGQLNVIRRDFTNKDTKKIQICNPNKLYQAVYPEKYEATMLVWEGLTYGWVFDNSYGNINYITKERFDYSYKQDFSDFTEMQTVSKTENIEDRDSTVTYYTTVAGEFKRVCYKLEQGEKTLYVAEKYCLEGYTDYTKNNVSLDIPKSITILGEQENEYFRIYLSKLEQRPSEEYLLEFGLRELLWLAGILCFLSILCDAANTWTTNFYTKMLQGATLQEAVEYARDLADESSGLKSAVIGGDSTIVFP